MLKGFFIGVVFYFFSAGISFAQNLAIADSLEKIYETKKLSPGEKLDLLKLLAEEHPEPDKKLKFSKELIDLSITEKSPKHHFSGYIQRGQGYRVKGDLSEALKELLKAAAIARKHDLHREMGLADVTIGDVYSVMGSHERSVEYYQKAIEKLQEVEDSVGVASAYLNLGDEYFSHEVMDSAYMYYQKSEKIFKALDYEIGVAYNIGGVGLIQAKRGDFEAAEENIRKATELLERNGDFYPISVYLKYMSDVHQDRGNDSLAMEFAMQSLELAQTYDLKDQISESSLKVSQLLDKAGKNDLAYLYFKDHIKYRDSVRNLDEAQEIANIRADYEVAQKQIEVDLLNEQRENQQLVNILAGTIAVSIAVVAFGLYRRNRYINKTSAIINKERNRSENLLLNILPAETAAELKQYGKVKAKKIEGVSVMFADFKNFSSYARKMDPERLLANLDMYFSEFDRIVHKYGLEKIKTLGDCYMIAGGLPFPDKEHPVKIIKASFEIIEFVEKTRKETSLPDATLDIRIGVHTGTVVAGVVGSKKFAYDIWGDTVNIASRLQSSSEAGKINVSQSTCRLINRYYDCDYRGKIEVKNRGELKMFYVRKKELNGTENKTEYRSKEHYEANS